MIRIFGLLMLAISFPVFAQKPVKPHIQEKYWNITLKSLTDSLIFERVPNGQHYEVWIYERDAANNWQELSRSTIKKGIYGITPILLPSIRFGQIYKIEVGATVNGVKTVGTPSYFTTPSFPHIQILNKHCGQTIPIHRSLVLDPNLGLPSKAQIKIENIHRVQLGKPYWIGQGELKGFTPSLSKYINFGRTYFISVKGYWNGDWHELFGPPCEITIEDPPKTKLRDKDCGSVLISKDQTFAANLIPGAGGYDFLVIYPGDPDQNYSDRWEELFPRDGKDTWTMNLKWLDREIKAGATYQVKVRIRRYDEASKSWTVGEFGETCDVTVPK